MVRFSDIIKTDSMSIRKTPAPERGLPAEEPVQTDEKAVAAEGIQISVDLLPADTGSEDVRTCYRQLFENTTDLRDRVLKSQEIDPSPAIAIFRHSYPRG